MTSIRALLENLNTLFELNIPSSVVDQLEENNEFFLECGMLAIEMAARSTGGLSWHDYGRVWWRKAQKATLKHATARELLALSYLAYASREFGPMHLPTGMRPVIVLHRCSFPGCESTDKLQEDHIWPKSLGGPDYSWNRQQLCERHNKMKSNCPGLNFCDPSALRAALTAAFR